MSRPTSPLTSSVAVHSASRKEIGNHPGPSTSRRSISPGTLRSRPASEDQRHDQASATTAAETEPMQSLVRSAQTSRRSPLLRLRVVAECLTVTSVRRRARKLLARAAAPGVDVRGRRYSGSPTRRREQLFAKHAPRCAGSLEQQKIYAVSAILRTSRSPCGATFHRSGRTEREVSVRSASYGERAPERAPVQRR